MPAAVPPGARPTSDRVREGWAAALDARDCVRGAHVLDLFAGTGAMGLELVSRGATSLLAVDRELRAFKQNVTALDAAEWALGQRLDLLRDPARALARLSPIPKGGFTVALVDPPYDRVADAGPLIDGLQSVMVADPVVCVEHRTGQALPALEHLVSERAYRYGDTTVDILRRM